ncbi:MAG: cytidine deaminase [Actinomycetota bacterium]|nr:cytidine deaminase [Actinomycetota bacterium]
MIDDITVKALVAKAQEALEAAYSPYSGYAVGAAVLAANESTYSGANIENAAYGESLCAERVAVAKAVSEGARDIVAVAIVAGDGKPAAPCGACRQVIHEFNPDCLVIMAGDEETIVKTVGELLPMAFRLKKRG